MASWALIFSSSFLVETNRAGFTKVKQAAVIGTLSVHDEPGMFTQLFGEVFEYKKADTYFFSKHSTEGEREDTSIDVRFNDNFVFTEMIGFSLADLAPYFDSIRGAGAQLVERVVGETAEETKEILDEMAKQGQRFRNAVAPHSVQE